MVLVDSSVWIDHFRKGHTGLAALLNEASVLTHPFIIGELACGNLKHRNLILENLAELPAAAVATHEEAFDLLLDRKLYARGIGWVDAHLIASALLSNCPLWTLDERLKQTAASAGVAIRRL
ncbi:MAG TPA: PIN domain-containing protein [Bryobacteraceae bacterium]|jgi:predicted nucleic acid-binding protein|nr:PIN domain-containing protein [Bryobacteraceae bacterium]